MDLASRESAVAWDLRGAWASRSVVVLLLEEVAVVPRLEGYVEHVSPTNATMELDALDGLGVVSVPCAVIRSVRKPHFHEPADAQALLAPARGPRASAADLYPGQLSLDLDEEAPPWAS